MEIRKNLTNVNYTPRGTEPSWIVIHNTANSTSAPGTAYSNTQFFKAINRNASAHYFIDDGEIIWQCVEDTNTAWHVGDQPSRNGCTNFNAIGIEVCERADGSFSDKEIATLSELVCYLMEKYNIPESRICRHHDVTGKICPRGYIDSAQWNQLKETITGGFDMITEEDIAKIWNYKIGGVEAWKRLFGIDEYQTRDIPAQVWRYGVAGKKTQAQDRLYGMDQLQIPAIKKELDQIKKDIETLKK